MPYLFLVFVTALVLGGTAGDAWAWGPGVHLVLGSRILDSVWHIVPSLAPVLLEHRNAFLYGCLSADILVGKGSRIKAGHSHNWSVGRQLVRDTEGDPKLTAWAHGYLTHLAADVVAHNYYVPNMLCAASGSGTLRHVLIEAEADRLALEAEPSCLACVDHRLTRPLREADTRLAATLGKNPHLFRLRKQILNGSLFFTGRKSWNAALDLASQSLLLPERSEYFHDMFDLAQRVAVDVLRDPEATCAANYDPIGHHRLRAAKMMHRTPPQATAAHGILAKDHADDAMPFLVGPTLACLPPAA